MICQECGVEFATTKIDAVVSAQDVYCSEFCCASEGWYTVGHLGQRTAALLQELETAVERVPQHRVFTALEQPLLEDTLAILRSESGAQRAAGPHVRLGRKPVRVADRSRGQRFSWAHPFRAREQVRPRVGHSDLDRQLRVGVRV